MDCFVEYEREEHAKMAVARFNDQKKLGKRPRVGDRQVRVQLSSQEALMMQLFPKAKCVVWKGQEPIITLPMDTHNSGFRGFITSEEMVMTVRWAENPARVSTVRLSSVVQHTNITVKLHSQAPAARL